MEMNLLFHLDDLSALPVSPSYYSSDEEMDVDIQSVSANRDGSEDSDIEVIACYRQVPIQTGGLVAGRKMTVELPESAGDTYPDFPWEDFDSMMQLVDSQADPLDRGAEPSTTTQSSSPSIKYCGQLTPSVDHPCLLHHTSVVQFTIIVTTQRQRSLKCRSNRIRIYKD